MGDSQEVKCGECGALGVGHHLGSCSHTRVNQGRDGQLHHMLCLVIVTGGLDGPCDCRQGIV